MNQNISQIRYYKHPILFYFLCTFISWVFWFLSAYYSHLDSNNNIYSYISGVLELLGLITPPIIAFSMIYLEPKLREDFIKRFFNFKKSETIYILLACFLMLVSIVLAQLISLAFGYSVDQFKLSGTTSFKFSLFPAWFMLFLAPIIEELAWHTYGTDCLRQKFNLFITSIIFAAFWVMWHFPLSFIKDYYQSNVLVEGWIYSLNFSLSLFPFVLLMNWLYYKTGRNILVAIIFHATAGVFNEIFFTHPDSKIIQTILLLMLTLCVLYKDKKMFFAKEYLS